MSAEEGKTNLRSAIRRTVKARTESAAECDKLLRQIAERDVARCVESFHAQPNLSQFLTNALGLLESDKTKPSTTNQPTVITEDSMDQLEQLAAALNFCVSLKKSVL